MTSDKNEWCFLSRNFAYFRAAVELCLLFPDDVVYDRFTNYVLDYWHFCEVGRVYLVKLDAGIHVLQGDLGF